MHKPPLPIPDDKLPSIAVGLLNYNRAQVLIESLEILCASDYPTDRMRLLVVDNASTDGTSEKVAARFGDRVEMLRQSENIGPVARNRVMLTRQEDYVFIFDEDCAPEQPGTIRAIIEFMEANRYFGALCFRSINSHTGTTEYGEWGEFSRRRLRNGGYEGIYVAGNGMCFRNEAIRGTGGYDERWFFGHEEHALALELMYHDIPTAFVPRFALIHRQAPRAIPSDAVIEREVRNNIWAAFKFFNLPMAIFIASLLTFRRYIMLVIKRGPAAAIPVVRGAGMGVRGIPQMLATHQPIPISRVARYNRWFWQSFYSPRQVRQAARRK